jgi:hypothetical protein
MPTEDEYGERAKRLLRAEMVRRGVSYETLSERLAALGLHDSPVNLRNKVSRGKFTAAFLLAACEAMGAETLRLAEGH